jgi:hypothetical protein
MSIPFGFTRALRRENEALRKENETLKLAIAPLTALGVPLSGTAQIIEQIAASLKAEAEKMAKPREAAFHEMGRDNGMISGS